MLLTTRNLKALCAATALAGALVPAAGASAADQIGAVNPDSLGTCSDQVRTLVSLEQADRMPYDGVVTRIRSQAAGEPGTRFAYRFFRFAGENRVAGVGTVKATVGAQGVVDLGTRVPVRQGDHLGLSKNAVKGLRCTHAGGHAMGSSFTNLPDGEAFAMYVGATGSRLNMLVTLERDADRDGFGDESQDGCPSLATTHGPCPVPAKPPVPQPEPRETPPAAVCTVPKLKGLKLKTAKRRLKQAGCAVGAVRKGKAARKAKAKRLRVRRQSVKAGTVVPAGTKVAFRVRVKRARR